MIWFALDNNGLVVTQYLQVCLCPFLNFVSLIAWILRREICPYFWWYLRNSTEASVGTASSTFLVNAWLSVGGPCKLKSTCIGLDLSYMGSSFYIYLFLS